MIALTTTSEKLQVVLGESISTTEAACVAAWRNLTSATYAAGSNQAMTTAATAIDLIPAPAASHQIKVDFLSVYNTDDIPHTVTIQIDRSSVTYPLWRGTLAPGAMVQYHEGKGFQKLDEYGTPVSSLSDTAPVVRYDIPQVLTFDQQQTVNAATQASGDLKVLAWENNGGTDNAEFLVESETWGYNEPDSYEYFLNIYVDTAWDYTSSMVSLISNWPLRKLVYDSPTSGYPLYWTNTAAFYFVETIEFRYVTETNFPYAVHKSQKLKYIYINDSGNVTVGPTTLPTSPLLEEVSLTNCAIQDFWNLTGANCPKLKLIELTGCTDASFTAAKMDAVYQKLDALTIDAGAKVFIGNGRYTSASDAARTSLGSKGWTITL